MAKMNVKTGDTVVVITGKDAGKIGKVLSVSPKTNRVVVEGVNIATKAHKARSAQDKSEFQKVEAAINVSNVMPVCPKCGKATRVKHAEVDGKKVQIKGTQGKESIVIREEPEYLLVEYLDKESGTIREIYNGPGALAWQYRSYVPSMNFYTIRINKLLELDATISDEERITPIVSMRKYIKNTTGGNRSNVGIWTGQEKIRKDISKRLSKSK